MHLSFLFHFNQNIDPYTRVADIACYKGFLAVLRKHKKTRFNVQISGTLIESLIQYAPETLKELQRAVSEGRLELMGSTFAQNVPAATDEISNRFQVEQHLEILARYFHVRPNGFWIPERCWKQNFVKLLTDFGYTYTLVEKQTLEKLSLKNLYLPYQIGTAERSISIVQDDEHFKHIVNFAVWTGDGKPAVNYLRGICRNKDSNRSACGERSESIVVYAEDAEASGLWGAHFGAYPQPVWKNWDKLLTILESDPNIKVCAVGDFLTKNKIRLKINSIPDGSAEWMNQSLKKIGAPYHEDGYKDWFDFKRRSPKIKKYGKLFFKLASQIQKTEMEMSRFKKKNPKKQKLIRKLNNLLNEAKLALCRHQYEFGCIGIGTENYQPFDDARKCLIPLKKIWEFLNKRRRGGSYNLKKDTGRTISVNQRGFRNQRISAFIDSGWKKFKKEVPVKQVWFKNYIADWIFDLAPKKVIQYIRK